MFVDVKRHEDVVKYDHQVLTWHIRTSFSWLCQINQCVLHCHLRKNIPIFVPFITSGWYFCMVIWHRYPFNLFYLILPWATLTHDFCPKRINIFLSSTPCKFEPMRAKEKQCHRQFMMFAITIPLPNKMASIQNNRRNCYFNHALFVIRNSQWYKGWHKTCSS